ncbi:hypothetical protein [Rhodopseudomonas palustris]|uniref:hypothetical protein n=1 Tax=Rhodopseudomonas palustris TaxID=1076 RepID=UPI001F249AE2|nr:hypothetical protein [Rhodopseudomonas palustris]
MLGFFAPVAADGSRVTVGLDEWRLVAARVAAALSTPLPAVMAMDWDDVVLWFGEAVAIGLENRVRLEL